MQKHVILNPSRNWEATCNNGVSRQMHWSSTWLQIMYSLNRDGSSTIHTPYSFDKKENSGPLGLSTQVRAEPQMRCNEG